MQIFEFFFKIPWIISTRITDPVSDSELHWFSLCVQTCPQLTSSSSDVSSIIGSSIELRCVKNPKSPFTWHSENCDAPYGIHENDDDNDPLTSKLSILCRVPSHLEPIYWKFEICWATLLHQIHYQKTPFNLQTKWENSNKSYENVALKTAQQMGIASNCFWR